MRDYLWGLAIVAAVGIVHIFSIDITATVFLGLFTAAMLIYVGRSLEKLHRKVDSIAAKGPDQPND